MMKIGKDVSIAKGDCLELMKSIKDGSVDMILCDLPYKITACKWDKLIPFELMWEQYNRIIKDKGAIVLTASQPFTSALVMSNPKMFKYEWIWEKTRFTGNLNATIMPLKAHENVLVFCKGKTPYFPIKTEAPEHMVDKRKNINPSYVKGGGVYNNSKPFVNIRKKDDGTRYPTSIQKFKNPNNNTMHPTQKPVELMEYLINTYTNEGETVLDNCMGSGTTGVACINTNRRFIGIEQDDKYFDICVERLTEANQTIFK